MADCNWSEERVTQLKSLWQEGLSASEVARALGAVTRNAVLGKLHRLGLLGAASETRPARSRSSVPRHRAVRVCKTPISVPVVEPDPLTFEDGSFATLATISDRMCRWPIGDPKTGGFHFCGQAPKTGYCYCEAHALRAHQPSAPKARRKVRQLHAVGGR